MLDFAWAKQSFERIAASLGSDDLDALIPPCLEVLEFSNQFIRSDTLLCLMYISLGRTLCTEPPEEVAAAMREHAEVLARHDTLLMLARSLDFALALGPEATPQEEGVLEREFRLIFNCIYLQLLFLEPSRSFVHTLELGQGRLGASLVTLLFDAAKVCADHDKIPIKKVVLLLQRVLQLVLHVPDQVLDPMPIAASSAPDVAPPLLASLGPAVAAAGVPMKRPRLKEFQAFTSLHLYERGIRIKYAGSGFPAAVEEGLSIIEGFKDEFLETYTFHPAELAFLKGTSFLQDAWERYQELRDLGKVACRRDPRAPTPKMPEINESHHRERGVGALGRLASMVPDEDENKSAFADDSERGSMTSTSSQSTASTVRRCVSVDPMDEEPLPDMPLPSDGEPEVRASETPLPSLSRKETKAARMSAFDQLYSVIFPRLSETIVLLLRLLLTSSSNAESYPGVVDVSRERRAVTLQVPLDPSETGLEPPPEVASPAIEAAEAQRHREILAAAVGGVVLILLKQARQSVSEQFSSVAQLVADSNGALVVLKFLNQDLAVATETPAAPPVLPCLEAVEPTWQAVATLRLVEVLYLLCKDSPERVRKFLIHYKAHFILKRLHRVENPQVQKLVFKLLKKQVRYLPRKWKHANMKAISAIYALVSMNPLDDWLLNEPLGDPATEGPSQADIRASNMVFNTELMRERGGGHPTANEGDTETDVPPPPPPEVEHVSQAGVSLEAAVREAVLSLDYAAAFSEYLLRLD